MIKDLIHIILQMEKLINDNNMKCNMDNNSKLNGFQDSVIYFSVYVVFILVLPVQPNTNEKR